MVVSFNNFPKKIAKHARHEIWRKAKSRKL